jgi:hypothetical protein
MMAITGCRNPESEIYARATSDDSTRHKGKLMQKSTKIHVENLPDTSFPGATEGIETSGQRIVRIKRTIVHRKNYGVLRITFGM